MKTKVSWLKRSLVLFAVLGFVSVIAGCSSSNKSSNKSMSNGFCRIIEFTGHCHQP